MKSKFFRRLRLADLIPFVALAVFGWLFWRQLETLDLRAIFSAAASVEPVQWVIAGLATLASLMAVGHYDAVIHRVMGTGISAPLARASGIRAIAIAQTIGFGSITGALIRWRCLPMIDVWTATRLSVLVSVSFLGAWVVVAAVVVLLTGSSMPPMMLFAAASLLTVAALAARFRHRIPYLSRMTPRDLAELLVWTLVDTAFAAVALGVLLPDSVAFGFGTLFAAYLLALGAGLLSSAPGGVGAFELTLLAVLPVTEAEPVLGAVLAFRIVYYVVPAVIGTALIFRPLGPATPSRLRPTTGVPTRLGSSPAPSEWGLAAQDSCLMTTADRTGGWLVRNLGRYCVAIGDGAGRTTLTDFVSTCRDQKYVPLFYKVGARNAAALRKTGWYGLRTADEAVLQLRYWSPDRPSRRQLRRKIRQAEGAGVTVRRLSGPLPDTELTRVATAWAKAAGGERGCSMGRFDVAYLEGQVVLAATAGGRLLAFASFHAGQADWTLDLMRQEPDAPDGTMHLLVAKGIEEARRSGAMVFSLAAVPAFPAGRFARLNVAGRGLRQFKSAFGPQWRPRYYVAPTRIAFANGLLKLALAIFLPSKIQSRPKLVPTRPDFQIETDGPACDAPTARLKTRVPRN